MQPASFPDETAYDRGKLERIGAIGYAFGAEGLTQPPSIARASLIVASATGAQKACERTRTSSTAAASALDRPGPTSRWEKEIDAGKSRCAWRSRKSQQTTGVLRSKMVGRRLSLGMLKTMRSNRTHYAGKRIPASVPGSIVMAGHNSFYDHARSACASGVCSIVSGRACSWCAANSQTNYMRIGQPTQTDEGRFLTLRGVRLCISRVMSI